MSTTILLIAVLILFLFVLKLAGVVVLLSGWMLKLLVVAALVVFLFAKAPKRRGRN